MASLARFAAWQVRSRLQDEVIVDWISGAKLAVRRGMSGATGNIYCGLHEYVDMRFVLDILQPEDLFVDVGANIGSYTILAAKVCNARVIAVEPDPGTSRALRRNIAINGIAGSVHVVEAALGASGGRVSFTVGLDTVNRVAQTGDLNTREVALRTLDEVLDGEVPRIIKIDVEGFEAEVLKGASATLHDDRLKAIITETLDQDVEALLTRAGFERAFYDPETRIVGHVPVVRSANALMVRPSLYNAPRQ